MKTVYQNPDKPECGAACFAMLALTSLSEAREVLYGRDRNAKRLGRRKILKALATVGIRSTSSRATLISRKNRLRDVKGIALVQGETLDISRVPLKSSKHWLIWDGKQQALRDPMGFYEPVKLTSYTEFM